VFTQEGSNKERTGKEGTKEAAFLREFLQKKKKKRKKKRKRPTSERIFHQGPYILLRGEWEPPEKNELLGSSKKVLKEKKLVRFATGPEIRKRPPPQKVRLKTTRRGKEVKNCGKSPKRGANTYLRKKHRGAGQNGTAVPEKRVHATIEPAGEKRKASPEYGKNRPEREN